MDIEEDEIEVERPTRMIRLDKDPKTRETDKIGLDML